MRELILKFFFEEKLELVIIFFLVLSVALSKLYFNSLADLDLAERNFYFDLFFEGWHLGLPSRLEDLQIVRRQYHVLLLVELAKTGFVLFYKPFHNDIVCDFLLILRRLLWL